MTQDEAIILCLKIVLIAAFCSLTTWIIVYTRLAAWWRDPIGPTLVIKSGLLALALVPSILALFFNFSRQDSRAAGWIDVAIIGLITPVMAWRTMVWLRIHRQGRDSELP